MSQKIWVTGDAVVDLIPDGENHYLRCAGGAPANVAVGVARLGSPSAFIGRVGNDPLGQFMQDTLNAENVNTQHMILDPQHRTSTVIVGLDNGERSFTFMVNPSADQFLQASDLPPFQQGEWLHCCSIALINNPSREATFEAIRRIKAAGGFFSFDPNLRESLWSSLEEMKTVVMEAVALADVLKFSEEETAAFATTLSKIVDMVELLGEVDTTGVAPTTTMADRKTVLRPDVAEEGTDRDRLFKNVPEKDNYYIKVPAILDDGGDA